MTPLELLEGFRRLKNKIEQMEIVNGEAEQTEDSLQIVIPESGSGGTSTLFAKITANTDANNYTATIYTKSDLSDTSPTVGKSVYVRGVSVTLANNTVLPVQESQISGIDYECIQTLILLKEA